MRLFVSLSYNGGSYSGWQSQPNAVSVQSSLERALSIAFSEEITVVGAGRTDAGVNASYYVAHFDVSDGTFVKGDQCKSRELLCKTNAILPPDIKVLDFFSVSEDAHARFDAVSRTYHYFVHTEKDPFAIRSYWYKFGPLDINAMNRASMRLIGEKDFSSFEKSGGANVTSICTVTEARWERLDETHLMFVISANRFLRNMVRAIVGTLLEVGRGKHSPEWIDEVLVSRNRGVAGQSVAGEALYLADVRYPYPLITI